MAVTAKWYGKGLLGAFNKEVDWAADTIKCALCTSSYTPDQDTHDYYDDLTNEVTDTGYSAGGATLGSCTATWAAATNRLVLDAANASWAASSITARYAIVYVDTGTDGTSLLLGYVDFGADVVSSSGTFTVEWSADGVLYIEAS